MTPPFDKAPAPVLWPRSSAIEAFGVRYIQRGGPRTPVVESLGANPSPDELLDGCRHFASEAAAIQRVQADAREEATRELARCDQFLEATSFRLRLSMARTWRFARSREVGILATASILEQTRREQRSVLRNGVTVQVRRLPDPVRLPAMLSLGQVVQVVDTRAFPRVQLRIVQRPVLALSFVEAPSHPEFDQLVRYRVRDFEGLAYDHAQPGPPRLTGAPVGVEVFIDPAEAVRFVEGYAADVMTRLGKPDAAPPPVELVREETTIEEGIALAVSSVAARVAAAAPAPAPVPEAGLSPSAAAPVPEPLPPPAPEPAPEAGADAPAPVLDESDVRPGKVRRGLLSRFFGRAAPDPEAGDAELPEAPSPEPLPESASLRILRDDPLPDGIILDEMESAVMALAATVQRAKRPVIGAARPASPPDSRHPECSAFLARGGLVLVTSAGEDGQGRAEAMLALLLPESRLLDAPPCGPDRLGETAVDEGPADSVGPGGASDAAAPETDGSSVDEPAVDEPADLAA